MEHRDDFTENNDVVVLEELAGRVRAAHSAVRASESNALDSALDAGDALLVIQSRIAGSMKGWMAENLPDIGASTLKLYMQLARSRDEIERNAASSICEARRLISQPRGNSHHDGDEDGDHASEEPALELTDEQVLAALSARGVGWFVANMPAGWREVLQARLRGPILRAEQRAHPNTRLKNLNLRLVSSTDRPTQH